MNRAVRLTCAVLAIAGLAACASLPQPPAGPPKPSPSQATAPRGDVIPDSPIDLGPYGAGEQRAVAGRFARGISNRYSPDMAFALVLADLRKNAFQCFVAGQGSGDPPRQVCRKTVRLASCEHIFQVHLYDTGGNQKLARTRALYDRLCGGEELLGAPPR
ncbi:MAG: hypothetical protein ACOYJ6_16855 [Caulobacterales bacterium]|jgi:hypothetical protein